MGGRGGGKDDASSKGRRGKRMKRGEGGLKGMRKIRSRVVRRIARSEMEIQRVHESPT